jgi:hypothetical protein
VFAEQVTVLRDITVIEIGNTEVEKNAEQQRKIKDHSVLPITHVTDLALHFGLYKNCPERFDEEVKNDKDGQVKYELFLLHLKADKYSFFYGFS